MFSSFYYFIIIFHCFPSFFFFLGVYNYSTFCFVRLGGVPLLGTCTYSGHVAMYLDRNLDPRETARYFVVYV